MKTSSNIQIGKQRVEGGRTVGWMVGRMAKGKRALSRLAGGRDGVRSPRGRLSSVAAAALTLSIEAVEPRRSLLLLAFAVAARGFCRRLRARGAADRLLYPAGAVVGGRGGRARRAASSVGGAQMVVAVMERAFTRRGERDVPSERGKQCFRRRPPLAWDDGCSVGRSDCRSDGRTADPSNCSSLGEGEGESEEEGMGQMREGEGERGATKEGPRPTQAFVLRLV